MNAVEISDGDCAGAFVRGAGKAADNLHAGLLDEGCLNDGQNREAVDRNRSHRNLPSQIIRKGLRRCDANSFPAVAATQVQLPCQNRAGVVH